MHNRSKVGLLFLIVLLSACTLYAKDSTDVKFAREFIAMMDRGEFNLAQSMFDSTMKQAAPEWKLRAIWTSFTKESGKLEKELSDTTTHYEGYEIVVVTCEFEKFNQDIRVVFDKEGKIGGFFFGARHQREGSGAPHPQPADTSKAGKQSQVGATHYISKEVTFENKEGKVTLAGTLTVPDSGDNFPAVLLIAGSGPNSRNETVAGHALFRTLAEYLSNRGIAVLRYDKRGIGKSSGNYTTATTFDFASDALAGVEYLRTLKQIDHHEIGLIGHSEGGEIAPIVANESHAVAFVVLMGAPGVPGYETIMDQVAAMGKAAGLGDSVMTSALALERHFLQTVMSVRDSSLAAAQLLTLLVTEDRQDSSLARMTIDKSLSPWYRNFLSYDPGPALRKVKCPVLALWGSKDLQVPPDKNLTMVEKALKAEGNRDVKVVEFPGLNHLFQDADTGLPSEYASISEDMSPVALATISNWILMETGRMK